MNKREIIEALSLEDFDPIHQKAQRICEKEKGNIVNLRAIIEFSNICSRGCTYCGLNKDNFDLERYEMNRDEIVEAAKNAVDAGYKTIVLQSGETQDRSVLKLGEIVKDIKNYDVAITVSCGELTYDELKYLKDCGADRYLLKHETADKILYKKLHPDSSIDKRVDCLKNIHKLGYETGGGFMIGLPGQSIEIIAEDLLLLKEIPCDMAGIGPFIPSPNTPLENEEKGSTELTKRAISIARILLPKANLPVTTSLGVLDKKEQRETFSYGANVIMKKVTPDKYKEKYQIYPAKLSKTDIKKDREEILEMLKNIGRVGE